MTWHTGHTGIEDHRSAETVLAGEKRLLERIASGDALPVLLDDLCRLVDALADGSCCSVLLIDRMGLSVRHGAGPGLPASFRDGVDGRPTSRPFWGPCAVAIDERRSIVVPDIAADDRWIGSEWCALALGAGLRSCWTTPILARAGTPLGTFALYHRTAGSPTALQHELIARFTHLASIAIERAASDAALRESEAFFAEVQRLSSTGSFSWRPATDEIVWSDETYRIYDLDPAKPVTFDAVGARIHPDEAAWFGALLGRARDEGRDLEFEHRLLMPDQSVKFLHVRAHATHDRDGQLVFIGAVQDVTDRRRSEDALDRLRSALTHMARVSTLGVLTASIAHEVNQPLSGIVTNATTSLRLLAGDPPDVDGASEAARLTMRDAHRASDVVARLRALYRKMDTTSEPIDLNDAVRDVIALSLRDLQSHHIIVRLDLADDLPAVTADRVQLQQVVLNLILNAVEAMAQVADRPRTLVVRTARSDAGDARLAVEDTGVGFDAKDANRLFDPFFTTKRDGMGIGLSISRTIIENHQGRIWARPNDGHGATFEFSVPRVLAPLRPRHSDDP